MSCRLAWCSDTHFNFLKPEKIFKFGRMISGSADKCVITGDISEGNVICDHLTEFQKGFGGDVYFVLGNHDFYKSSFVDVRKAVTKLSIDNPKLHYLGDGQIRFIGDTQLLGVDGWYDFQAGSIDRPQVIMSDWELIKDFRDDFRMFSVYQEPEQLIKHLRYLGQHSAVQASVLLNEADRSKPVLFATHVPPYREAAWHLGKPSDGAFLPIMTNIALGYALNEWASHGANLHTICGHTHSPGTYRASDNHLVTTGKSEYGQPQISKVFNL